MKTTILENTKDVSKKITSIEKTGKKFDADVHQVACSCIYHAQQHGDVTLATKLIKAMPRSGRSKTLREWFSKYSPLHWSAKTESFRINKGKSANPFDVTGAMDNPFWNEVEKTAKDFTIDQLIKLVERKLEKASNDGFLNPGDTDKLEEVVHNIQVGRKVA